MPKDKVIIVIDNVYYLLMMRALLVEKLGLHHSQIALLYGETDYNSRIAFCDKLAGNSNLITRIGMMTSKCGVS